jgi:LPS O-antigen subunit length determinant protein (WzzB/FepE family)
MEVTIILLMVLVLAAIAAVYTYLKKSEPGTTVSIALQNLTQTVQETHMQAAILSEKIKSIEEVPALVGNPSNLTPSTFIPTFNPRKKTCNVRWRF